MAAQPAPTGGRGRLGDDPFTDPQEGEDVGARRALDDISRVVAGHEISDPSEDVADDTGAGDGTDHVADRVAELLGEGGERADHRPGDVASDLDKQMPVPGEPPPATTSGLAARPGAAS